MNVCVMGLGYIGLPLAAVLARSGYKVLGVDIKPAVVRSIESGDIHGLEPPLGLLVVEAIRRGSLALCDPVPHADVYILAVPTPLKKKKHQVDLSYVEKAVDSVALRLRPGNLVIIESTVPVGTTEKMSRRLLELRPDLEREGKSLIFVAHCPERVLPGKVLDEMVEVDRIVGGVDAGSTREAGDFYATFVRGSIHRTEARTAEMCKLAENASRDVAISFANELSMLCDKMGIDAANLIRLANLHPRVNIMDPGPGVGGHCIPVDPWFLVQSEPLETSLIRTARKVNEKKTAWLLNRIEETISHFEKPVIACLGLAYKPEVADLRGSPAVSIVNSLCSQNRGDLRIVEPHIKDLPPVLAGFNCCRLVDLEEAIAEASVVALLTRHNSFEGVQARLPDGKVFIDPNGVVSPGWRRSGTEAAN